MAQENPDHNPPPFLLMPGSVSKEHFDDFCKKNGVDPEKAVFVFPGNKGHHGTGVTLYSKKNGTGLADVAGKLGDAGRPVLSLPTTGMDRLKSGDPTPPLAQEAIADLWKAVGFGLNIILPITERRFEEDGITPLFFPEHCQYKIENNLFEPRFWGGVESVPNLELAKYYFNQLEILKNVMTLDTTKREVIIKNIEIKGTKEQLAFVAAYKKGQAAQKDPSKDAWFQKPVTPTVTTAGPSVHGAKPGVQLDTTKITDLISFFENKKYTVVNNGGLLQAYRDVAKTQPVFAVSGDQITATEPKNDQPTYEHMIEAALIAFPGKTQLHVDNLSISEKEIFDKAEAALRAVGKIPATIIFNFGAEPQKKPEEKKSKVEEKEEKKVEKKEKKEAKEVPDAGKGSSTPVLTSPSIAPSAKKPYSGSHAEEIEDDEGKEKKPASTKPSTPHFS